jgi:hypothetical protein
MRVMLETRESPQPGMSTPNGRDKGMAYSVVGGTQSYINCLCRRKDPRDIVTMCSMYSQPQRGALPRFGDGSRVHIVD